MPDRLAEARCCSRLTLRAVQGIQATLLRLSNSGHIKRKFELPAHKQKSSNIAFLDCTVHTDTPAAHPAFFPCSTLPSLAKRFARLWKKPATTQASSRLA